MVELGHYALLLTVPFLVYAAGAAIVGARRERPELVKSAERSLYAVFLLFTLAIAGLEWALLSNRFELAYVAQTSSREQAWIYKIPALWGGQAGSLLFWGWMLSAFSALALFQNRNRNRALIPWVIVMLSANTLFFAVLTGFVTNPFEALPPGHAYSNGQGLNPILQHPVMLIHPPILYTGFVGFAIPFAFAFAALASRQLDTTWFRTTRRWTITAWFFLGCGIMLGGRWAYEVLGWGGYWGWDPVENASLMPFLVGTAYLHSVIIQEKRGMLRIWNLALIGLAYSLCLFGTFLTRSGVVQSVHSFTQSGWFGYVFLGYVVVMASVFFGMLIWRAPLLRSKSRLDSMVSREASFLLNNYVFLALCSVVFFGTLYPVFSEALTGQRIQIGPPFFQRYAGPLALALLFLTGVGPLIAWRRATWVNLRKSFVWPVLVALGVTSGAVALGVDRFYPAAFVGLCSFVAGTLVEEYGRGIRARMRRGESPPRAFIELVRRNQRRYGGYIVHLAVILIFIGFAGSAFEFEETRVLSPGERWAVNGYTLEYRQPVSSNQPNYAGAVARVALFNGDSPVGILKPEKRVYFQQEQPTTIPAISSSMREDIYLILVGLEPDRRAALKVFVNPLVNWIWIGGFVFIFGNALVLWPLSEKAKR
ncbi:MAG: heme lyase CcmF/NrfE family subunit [Myxococcota bacterium]|nr:heme lyase CcmF/NrfE family subunit [Myxococcota bacterium]